MTRTPSVRLFLDGTDITDIAVECDEREGWADCHYVDANGNSPPVIYVPERMPSLHRRYGKIRPLVV